MILIILKMFLCGLGLFHAADIGWDYTDIRANFTTSRVVGLLCAFVCILTGAFL